MDVEVAVRADVRDEVGQRVGDGEAAQIVRQVLAEHVFLAGRDEIVIADAAPAERVAAREQSRHELLLARLRQRPLGGHAAAVVVNARIVPVPLADGDEGVRRDPEHRYQEQVVGLDQLRAVGELVVEVALERRGKFQELAPEKRQLRQLREQAQTRRRIPSGRAAGSRACLGRERPSMAMKPATRTKRPSLP